MAATSQRSSRVGFGVVLLLGLLVVAWAAGRPPRDGEPLDPRSSGALGARGLVLFLDELGADVELSESGPTSSTDVAVVLDDRLTESLRDELVRFVGDGGTLVVADPFSPLSAPVSEEGTGLLDTFTGDLNRGECSIDALDGAEDIDVPGALLYEVTDERVSCFGNDQAAYIVSEAVGAGRVISIGSPTLLTNADLDAADHAVVVGALIAPQPGARVLIVEDPPPGDGEDSLGDLVADGVKAALVQLAIAFLIYALYRARRLGRPVPEPLPVQIAGSELVAAVGQLIQQSGDPGRAALVLQDDTRRTLARRLGLPVDAAPAIVADAVAGRVGADSTFVLERLTRTSIPDEASLVELAQSLDAIRQETLHVQSI